MVPGVLLGVLGVLLGVLLGPLELETTCLRILKWSSKVEGKSPKESAWSSGLEKAWSFCQTHVPKNCGAVVPLSGPVEVPQDVFVPTAPHSEGYPPPHWADTCVITGRVWVETWGKSMFVSTHVSNAG